MPAPVHPDGFRQLPSVVTWLSAVGRPPISRLRVLDAARVLALSSAAAAAAAGSEAAERRQRRPRSMSPTSPDSAHAAKRVRLERHRNAAQHGGRHSVRLEVGARVEALYADGYWYDAVIASLHFADQHLPSAAPPGVGGGDRGPGVGESAQPDSAPAAAAVEGTGMAEPAQSVAGEGAHGEGGTPGGSAHPRRDGAGGTREVTGVVVAWDDGDPADTFKAPDQLRARKAVREAKGRSRAVGRGGSGESTSKSRGGGGRRIEAEVWPELGDNVEMKKNLGALGWQWCHGTCIAVDKKKNLFCARVTHDVWWEGSIIVPKDDVDWYSVLVGWRARAADPDNYDAPVWPKGNRFVRTFCKVLFIVTLYRKVLGC